MYILYLLCPIRYIVYYIVYTVSFPRQERGVREVHHVLVQSTELPGPGKIFKEIFSMFKSQKL